MTSEYPDPMRGEVRPDLRSEPPTLAPAATSDEQEASYARYRSETRSIGEIAADLLDNATTLIRQELELAKAEAKTSASRVSKGIGLLVGAAVTALLALIAATLALWWFLAVVIGTPQAPALGWSGVAVAVLWFVVTAVLAVLGRNEFTRVRGLARTADTVKKIPNAVAGNEEKNR